MVSASTLLGLGLVLVLDITVSRGFQKPDQLILVQHITMDFFVPCYSISPIMSECPPTHPQSDFFFLLLCTINASDIILSIFFFLLLFFGLFLVLSCFGLVAFL